MATREENINALTAAFLKLSAGVNLSDAVDSDKSTLDGTAATPKAVKTAYDYTTDVAQSVLEAAKNATEGSDNVTDLREPLLADVYHEIGTWWISLDNSIPVGGLPHLGHLCARDTYGEFWPWCETNKTVVSDEEWLAYAESHNGCCPYYSYGDGSTTFRTPKYDQSFLKVLATIGGTGEMQEAGLPNITGSVDLFLLGTGATSSGALSRTPSEITGAANSGNYNSVGTVNLDASLSNSIYGNSDTVTPQNFGIIVGVYAVGAVSAPIGETDAANLLNGLSTLEAQMATTVRTVNGVSADAAGDVVYSDHYQESITTAKGQYYLRFPAHKIQIAWGYASTDSSTGKYTVSFNKPFNDTPLIIASPIVTSSSNNALYQVIPTAKTSSSCTFVMYNVSGIIKAAIGFNYFLFGYYS